jgi:hypothetical protein
MFFNAYVSLSQPLPASVTVRGSLSQPFTRIRHSQRINLGSRYCEHPVNEAQLGKSSRGTSC